MQDKLQKLIDLVNHARTTSIYDRDTTSNYWGDPNLRDRQTAIVKDLDQTLNILKEFEQDFDKAVSKTAILRVKEVLEEDQKKKSQEETKKDGEKKRPSKQRIEESSEEESDSSHEYIMVKKVKKIKKQSNMIKKNPQEK